MWETCTPTWSHINQPVQSQKMASPTLSDTNWSVQSQKRLEAWSFKFKMMDCSVHEENTMALICMCDKSRFFTSFSSNKIWYWISNTAINLWYVQNFVYLLGMWIVFNVYRRKLRFLAFCIVPRLHWSDQTKKLLLCFARKLYITHHPVFLGHFNGIDFLDNRYCCQDNL